MRKHFTTREVARILDISEARLRSCLRAALFPVAGVAASFSFHDLLLLKTTKGLLDAQVPAARIRRILRSLKRQLPADQQLWNVAIYADGRRVVVWDGTAHWQPDSGQFLFDFEPRALARQLPMIKHAPPRESPTRLTAEQWFDLALELEKQSPEEAIHAYGQAVTIDPHYTSAHVNLGRLQHEAKQFEQAEACYRAALRHDADDPLALFNLGVLLEETDRRDEAIAAYLEVLARDQAFADAHYNLALLYELQGKKPDAIRHFRAAQKLRRPLGRTSRRPFSDPGVHSGPAE